MDSPQIRPPDHDQLFSKPGAVEPAGPQMLGTRNADSVLFNIKELDVAAEQQPKPTPPPPRLATTTTPSEPDSGLIDIAKLVPDKPSGERAAIPNPTPPGSLVAEMQLRSPIAQQAVVAPPNKTQTYILVAAILALLGVAILLAIKAVG